MIKLLKFILLTQLYFSSILAQHHHDTPSVHGMLLFGKSKVYLSHLPMFHSPHNYQVLLEVKLPTQTMKKYLKAQQDEPTNKVFTIVPELFSLPKLQIDLKTFKAQIFKGHFERGGTPLSHQIEIEVIKVLLFKKFDPTAQRPENSNYFLIGNSKEQFIVHTIVAKPDYDHIAQVETKELTQLLPLFKNNALKLDLETSNDTPLLELVPYSAQVVLPAQISSNIDPIFFEISSSLYLEFGDLSF